MGDKEKQKSTSGNFSKFRNQLTASAALATLALHPIDTVKVRMQLGQGSGLQVINNMLRNKGIRSFYKGLSAGLVRQAAFTYIGAGSFQNYVNLPHALYRVVADEGILALWRGASPAIARITCLCLGYFAVAPSSNFLVHHTGIDRKPRGLDYIIGGLLPPALSKPYDYVKTQLQKIQPSANGNYPYTGPIDCALKTLKSGGPLKFYTGFSAYCLTSLPHALLTVAFLHQLWGQRIFTKLQI